MCLPRPVVFLLCQLMFLPHILAQTGTLAKIQNDNQASVVWDSENPPPTVGGLGAVVERNRLIAIFRILSSEKQSSMVKIVDFLVPGVLSKKQGVKLLDGDPSPTPPGRASLFIWSDRAGGSFQVDGKPAGQVPARVVVEPGSHEILLDLQEGGRAGVRVETHPDAEDFICVHGRSWPSTEGDGLPVFLTLAAESWKKSVNKTEPLRWLEDRQGLRVYACSDPVKNPVIKRKVVPHYPETARRKFHEGQVLLEALIGSDGRVQQVDVLSSPDPELSRAATEATLQWTYEPATLDGKAVPVFLTIMVDFYLKK